MDDLALAERLVEQGVTTRERVQECLRLRDELAARGESPVPGLIELLGRKGYVRADQVDAGAYDATLQSPEPATRPTARTEIALPPEASEAARNPANLQGKYIRVARVGAGGMGEVWRAWDRALGRWVALKFMKHEDEAEVARFRREAQTAAKLSHPNIAAIYEAEDTCIAMQFIHGQTLATVPRDNPRALVELVRDAALALQYAHEQGVIHRDLKPQNLMVEGKGGSRRLYVMDFGLAKETKRESSLSVTGNILGTPAYMPPEQARGRVNEIDARSDVYSLGATLYELLADRTPFVSREIFELLKKVIEEDPKPLRLVKRRIDADLETVVMKCLEKDPARRYATMQEFAEELGRWLKGEPILAHPPSAAYRVRKFLTRRKGLVSAIAGTAVFALAAWLVVGRVSRAREFDRLRTDAERAYGEKRWSEAKESGTRALELRAHPALSAIVADATARLTSEEADKQKRITEGRTFRELQDRLKPVESLINETRPFFYIEAVDIRAKLDAVEKALAEVEKLARAPEYAAYAEPWLLLGMGWYFAGDHDRSEEALLRAEALKPGDGRIHFYLTKLYMERSSISAIVTSLALDDTGERDLQAMREWTRKASDHARRAAEGWAGAEAIDRHLAACYEAVGRPDAAGLRGLCSEGQRRFPRALGSEEFPMLLASLSGTKAPKEGVALLDEALKRRPHYDIAFYERGIWKYLAEDKAGAAADFQRALEVNPRLTYAHIGLSAALEVLGDRDAAILEADRFIQAHPRSLEGYVTRALALAHKGDHAGAVADCSRGLEINPNSWRCLVQRGQSRRRAGDPKGAIEDYTRAIEVKPGAGEIYTARARILVGQGDAKGALGDLDKALAAGDRKAGTYSFRGLLKFQAGDSERALLDFEEALRIDPEDPAAHEGRGAVRHAKGDLAGALADFEQLVRLRPKNPNAWLNRGKTRMDRGDLEGAISDLTRAIELDPADADARSVRGKARWLKKDEEGGVADVRKAIELSNDPELRKSLEEWLEKVRPKKDK